MPRHASGPSRPQPVDAEELCRRSHAHAHVCRFLRSHMDPVDYFSARRHFIDWLAQYRDGGDATTRATNSVIGIDCDDVSRECCVCLVDRTRFCMPWTCGHMDLCVECVEFVANPFACPLCRNGTTMTLPMSPAPPEPPNRAPPMGFASFTEARAHAESILGTQMTPIMRAMLSVYVGDGEPVYPQTRRIRRVRHRARRSVGQVGVSAAVLDE